MSYSLIDTIFNCVNLAARIGIVVYLIKKYIAPKISSSIIYEKESLKILELQQRELKDQSLEIENQIKNQEQIYFDLQSKFEAWQQALIKDEQEHERVCKEHEQKLAYQLEKKQRYAARKMLIAQELPALLQQAEQDLQAKVKQDPKLGKKYIQNILDAVTGKLL